MFFPALLFGWLRCRTGGIGAAWLHAMSNLFSATLGRGYGLSLRGTWNQLLRSRLRYPLSRRIECLHVPRRAALFDMDRTLLRVETASLYVRYQRRIGEATTRDLARVLWWVLLYTFNLIDAPRVATRVLASLDGTWETVLAARCDDWFSERRGAAHL